MEVSIIMSDEEVDLASRIADVAVRVKKPTQANLIFKKFVNFHNHIYGSSDYLQSAGIPRNINDLDKHSLICFGSGDNCYIKTFSLCLGMFFGLFCAKPCRIRGKLCKRTYF